LILQARSSATADSNFVVNGKRVLEKGFLEIFVEIHG
jgi:hypothetical protein